MAAVCLVLQPWRASFNPNLTAILLGYTTAGISGISSALDIIAVFWYEFLQSTDNQIKTLFWLCVSGLVLSAAAAFSFENFTLELDWSDWLLIMGHSATYIAIMLLYMYASALVPGLIALIGSTSTVYVLVAQYTVLSGIHPGNRNWMEILGVALVIITSVAPSVVKARGQNCNPVNSEMEELITK